MTGARRTVEDQLRELGEHMGFDFMLVSAPDGSPLAGVVRPLRRTSNTHGQLIPLDVSLLDRNHAGFLLLTGRTFQVASVPVDENDENIGMLSVGEYFDFSDLTTAGGAGAQRKSDQLEPAPCSGRMNWRRALTSCHEPAECDLRLQGTNWISLPMESYGSGFLLLSFENVDEATAPIQSRLHKLFLTLSFVCVLVAFFCSVGSSSSIVKPLAAVVAHLRNAVDGQAA